MTEEHAFIVVLRNVATKSLLPVFAVINACFSRKCRG